MAVESIPFTKVGYDALSKELATLRTLERPKIIAEIAEARAHGDLSENAEYHAAREKQSFVEARIKLLEDRLSRARIVHLTDQDNSQVRFGAYVTLERGEDGEEKVYQVVGELEADIEKNKISLSSPMGKALLGKRMDDLVEVIVPRGIIEFVIVDIQYSDSLAD